MCSIYSKTGARIKSSLCLKDTSHIKAKKSAFRPGCCTHRADPVPHLQPSSSCLQVPLLFYQIVHTESVFSGLTGGLELEEGHYSTRQKWLQCENNSLRRGKVCLCLLVLPPLLQELLVLCPLPSRFAAHTAFL